MAALAAELDEPVPDGQRRAKGWVGRLLERLLGATAGSRDAPDFEQLGVELKTVPVGRSGRPVESTWVCVAPHTELEGISWERSRVRTKLARVLWVPVEARPIPLPERRLGSALLWSPTAQDWRRLRADWEELTDLIRMGQADTLSAELGEVLQIRPKGRNAADRRWGVGHTGAPVLVQGRGFYLRAGFTAEVLARHFVVAGG